LILGELASISLIHCGILGFVAGPTPSPQVDVAILFQYVFAPILRSRVLGGKKWERHSNVSGSVKRGRGPGEDARTPLKPVRFFLCLCRPACPSGLHTAAKSRSFASLRMTILVQGDNSCQDDKSCSERQFLSSVTILLTQDDSSWTFLRMTNLEWHGPG
jgi:hypothetical protein